MEERPPTIHAATVPLPAQEAKDVTMSGAATISILSIAEEGGASIGATLEEEEKKKEKAKEQPVPEEPSAPAAASTSASTIEGGGGIFGGILGGGIGVSRPSTTTATTTPSTATGGTGVGIGEQHIKVGKEEEKEKEKAAPEQVVTSPPGRRRTEARELLFGIERSPSSRAKCRICGNSIVKAELRVRVQQQGKAAMLYYHLYDFPVPAELTSMDQMTGIDDLSSDEKYVIQKMLHKEATKQDVDELKRTPLKRKEPEIPVEQQQQHQHEEVKRAKSVS